MKTMIDEIKNLTDLEKLHENLMDMDGRDREHLEYSSLPLDNNCEEPFDTSSIWSWATPMPEHENRPRYLLIGDGSPESWEIFDVLADFNDPSLWPSTMVIQQRD